MHLVTEKEPPEFELLECPHHGKQLHSVKLSVGVRLDDKGRAVKHAYGERYHCVECLLKGEFTEIGR